SIDDASFPAMLPLHWTTVALPRASFPLPNPPRSPLRRAHTCAFTSTLPSSHNPASISSLLLPIRTEAQRRHRHSLPPPNSTSPVDSPSSVQLRPTPCTSISLSHPRPPRPRPDQV